MISFGTQLANWLNAVRLFRAHMLTKFEGHALIADKREDLGQGVTHIVPGVTTVLPGWNTCSI